MAKKKASGEAPSPPPGEVAAAKPYVVLARKYRPQTFDDLIGQDAMVTTLRNAFAAGRIAQGYMLTGVRGVGKTTTARILARALNYEHDGIDRPTIDMPQPGRHCREIMESRHPDVIEMDAASNTGIDDVREIIENARYKPILARTKVFIVDEVHMLSKSAFNALLKTLEEPPEHVKFIFATTEIRKVPVTVLSRCQRFDLRRVDIPVLVRHFERILQQEGARADTDALALIARAAEGSVRDGLSILDQAIAHSPGTVSAENVRAMLGLADRGRIFDLLEQVLRGASGEAVRALDSLHRDGAEPAQLLADLAEAIHTTTRAKTVGAAGAGDTLSQDERRRAHALAERLSIPLLSRAWQMLLKGIEETSRAPDPLASAEMVLIRLAHTADLPTPDELIKALGGGTLSAGARAQRPSETHPAARGPLNSAPVAAPTASMPPATPPASAPAPQARAPAEPPPASPDDNLDEIAPDSSFFDEETGEDDIASSPAPARPQLRTFADVVELAGTKRDARLKVHLEENVSLVKFDATAGSIDIHLLSAAPQEIANELREKLNAWTGRRWVVMLSKSPGERTIGDVRREREAAELESLRRHPAVAAVLAEFPQARIADVKPLRIEAEDDSATG